MYSTLLIKAYHNLVWSLLESMAKIEWLFIPGTAFPLSPVNIKSLPMPSGKCNKFSLRHNRFFPKFRKSKYDSKVDKENSICKIEYIRLKLRKSEHIFFLKLKSRKKNLECQSSTLNSQKKLSKLKKNIYQ